MTQMDKMLYYMRTNGSITSLQATNDLKVMAPNRVITNLKKRGYNIVTEYKEHGIGHPYAVWREV